MVFFPLSSTQTCQPSDLAAATEALDGPGNLNKRFCYWSISPGGSAMGRKYKKVGSGWHKNYSPWHTKSGTACHRKHGRQHIKYIVLIVHHSCQAEMWRCIMLFTLRHRSRERELAGFSIGLKPHRHSRPNSRCPKQSDRRREAPGLWSHQHAPAPH